MYASLVTINKHLKCLIKIESVFHYWVRPMLRYNTNTIHGDPDMITQPIGKGG